MYTVSIRGYFLDWSPVDLSIMTDIAKYNLLGFSGFGTSGQNERIGGRK